MAISIVLIAVPPGGVPNPGQGWIGWAGQITGITGSPAGSGELSPAAPKPVWNNGPQAPPGPAWQPVAGPSAPAAGPGAGPAPVPAGVGGSGDYAPGMGF